MQETSPTTPPAGESIGNAIVWRLAQIVLVLAATYLYFLLGSFGGLLQRDRLFGNPHTWPLVQAALVGGGMGICIGLALKDLHRGRIVLQVDWPTLIINLLAAGIFVAVAVSFNVAALRNTDVIRGPIRDAVILSPLLPFVWVGLTLTTIVRTRT